MREFLKRVLTESAHTTGCGMSTRPEYYSGRGQEYKHYDPYHDHEYVEWVHKIGRRYNR